MKITVILCTFNRCEILAKALESAAYLTLPPSVEWEVLVVDNNSTDRTREVVEGFCVRDARHFRYLFEARPGKSHALDAGIRAASGDVLAFIDDDVKAEPTWLQNLTEPLHDEKLAGSGGRILPDWSCPPPSWLRMKERWTLAPLAIFDNGTDPGPLLQPPFGTNMAFRKSVFEKHGGFRTDLGPRPGSEIRNEDTEFGRRLLEAGEKLWYVPSAVVYHAVPKERIEKQYFLTWWLDKGRADTREYGVPTDTPLFLAGIPLYLFRRLAIWTLRWLFAPIPSMRFAAKLKVWRVVGVMSECRRLSRVPSKPARASRLG